MDDQSLKRDQLLRELQRTAVAQRKNYAPIKRSGSGAAAPPSFAQQRLWFIDQLEGGGAAYHVRVAIRLYGVLHREALRGSLDTILERHEALRTTFAQVSGELRQVIAQSARFALQEADLSGYSVKEREAQIAGHIAEESAHRFELSTGPLIRGRLVRVGAEEHVLLLTMHHIVSDGWSVGLLLGEIKALYAAYREDRASPLAALPIQYADYAAWQRKWLQGEVLQDQSDYWKKQLTGAPALLELPTDRPRPTVQSYRGESVAFTLSAELAEQLKELAKRHDATLFMMVYAGLAVVLSRLSGQEDVVIGVPVANRQRVELEGLIGFFVNMLALRVQVRASESVSELLSRVRGLMLGGYGHQEIPFEQVVESLQPPRSLSHSPIFQIGLSWQNTLLAGPAEQWLPGLKMRALAVPNATAKFDLSWALQETEGQITGAVHYASDLFDRETVERWIGHFRHVLSEMARDARQPVGEISLLDSAQCERLLREFNATEVLFPREKVIHELFEAQARQAPDALAVVYEDQHLTYAELNRRSNQLAHYLRRQGVGPDQTVALHVERGLEMMVGLLGILKAGGAYVPLEPSYPPQRLEYMLADTAPRVLLTQAHLKKQWPEFAGPRVVLDSDWAQIEREAQDNLDPNQVGVTARHLAYVIYTSGSTGQPKGVMVEHRNVVNLVAWHVRAFNVVAGHRSSCMAGLGFDACAWEIWPPLCAGASLVLPAERITKDPEALLEWWRGQSLDQSFLATPLAEFALTRGLRNARLQTLLVGGDCLRHRPGESASFSLINNYGPTECAVVATSGPIHATDPVLHIGRPISNARIYILDGQGQPAPIGVAGEIHVGGAGVARGYLHNPQLTEERFVKDPFSTDADARMYQTGDIGRWLRDGNIEYLGRADGQIKIRGYRIELGEIEAQLSTHERVHEVVVIAREEEGQEQRLVAYVTLTEPTSARELREFLRSRIPAYMVPSAYVVLESVPMTSNGKVDRRALPAPDLRSMSVPAYQAPQGEIEAGLAGIWRELLRVERVGRHDNFFELGGHSLLVMQLLERMQRIGLRGTVLNVFEHPTLSELVIAVSGALQSFSDAPPNLISGAAITPQMLTMVDLTQAQIDRIVATVAGGASNVQDIYPLAPFQEGVLFHHLMNERADAYIFSLLLELRSRGELDELVKALQGVIDRHDLLRSAALWEGLPRPVQVVCRHAQLPVEEIDSEGLDDPLAELQARMVSQRLRMDVRQAPLIRLQVAPAADGVRWYVLLLQHHLINDHVGQELLLKELMAHLEDRAEQLTQPVGYRNFVWQTLAQADGSEAEAFFRDKLRDVEEPTAPFGLLDVHGDGRDIRQARHKVDDELSYRLRSQAQRLGVSAATLFHAAWALVVARTSHRDDVVFGSVLLGRMRGWRDIDRVMGMFINTLPLRIKLKDQSAEQLVRHVQHEIVMLLQHEQASLAIAQRCSGIAGSRPLFSAVLNYRHSAPASRSAALEEKGIRVLEGQERSNYPFLVAVSDFGEAFGIVAQTDPRVDPQRVAGYLHEALASLVDALESAPESLALKLNILPQAERRHILHELNATETPYPREKVIHELFEAQARNAPDTLAVVYEGQRLTYGQLNRRSNQLAHYLRKQELSPAQPVALHVERGLDMIVGLLGILKAGGAYLPLDPNYPHEQLEYMLQDAAPRVLLTQQHLSGAFPEFAGRRVALDSDWACIGQEEEGNLDPASVGIAPTQLAYVIYTSGSTGTPKGVAAPHAGLVNRVTAQEHFAAYASGDVCCHKTSLGFVDSIVEALGPLSYGLRLVIAASAVVKDAEGLAALVEREAVTWLITVPSLARALVATAENIKRLATLHHWTLSGEALTPALLRQLQTALPGCRFVNLYGSSEVAADATYYVSRKFDGDLVPIGRPLPNTRVYILDEQGEPAPIGVPGEIHVGGIAVARGYLNQPQLTAERFRKDPFVTDAQARMYRSGDLGRWLGDGNIEYLGRNDRQIKIRGYRVELDGIEAQLALHERVGEVAVIAREGEGAEKRLVAYVTLQKEASVRELREFLGRRLPEYMVPSAYVVLESLPMTPNGKVDRRALSDTKVRALPVCEYKAPHGEVEEVLAGIWRELLRVERVGREDNFFMLGGNSLLALQLVIRVRSRYSVKLPLPQIFALPTLGELAGFIAEAATDLKRYEAVEMGRSNAAYDQDAYEEILL